MLTHPGVNGIFDSIAHAFDHLAKDVATKLAPVVGPIFGVPPDVVAPLTYLLMRAEAGSSKAKTKLAALRADGGTLKGQHFTGEQLRPVLQRVTVAMHDHPHWSHFQSHAAHAVAKEREKRAGV